MNDDALARDTASATLPQVDSLLEMLDLDVRAGARSLDSLFAQV